MSETKIFEKDLSNGVKCEIHEAVGFAGRCEVAIVIEDAIAIVLSVEKKRGGNVECRPIKSHAILVKDDSRTEDEELEVTPNLDDVLDNESEEST